MAFVDSHRLTLECFLQCLGHSGLRRLRLTPRSGAPSVSSFVDQFEFRLAAAAYVELSWSSLQQSRFGFRILIYCPMIRQGLIHVEEIGPPALESSYHTGSVVVRTHDVCFHFTSAAFAGRSFLWWPATERPSCLNERPQVGID
jgi:hypothetical protein